MIISLALPAGATRDGHFLKVMKIIRLSITTFEVFCSDSPKKVSKGYKSGEEDVVSCLKLSEGQERTMCWFTVSQFSMPVRKLSDNASHSLRTPNAILALQLQIQQIIWHMSSVSSQCIYTDSSPYRTIWEPSSQSWKQTNPPKLGWLFRKTLF